MEDLRYPIGKFELVPAENEEQAAKRRVHYIDVLAKLPLNLRAAIQGLAPSQIETPYRPEGWTVREVVHHVADSHMNAYIRFKYTLTEDQPPIRGYAEALWAKLPDTESTPLEVSLQLVAALHARWIELLRGLKPTDFARTLMHSEYGVVNLDRLLALYAWHSAHHTAHITSLRERMGWNQKAAAS